MAIRSKLGATSLSGTRNLKKRKLTRNANRLAKAGAKGGIGSTVSRISKKRGAAKSARRRATRRRTLLQRP